MAIAIDKNNVIMNGNNVVLVMALLSRLQTNTLPRNSTDEL